MRAYLAATAALLSLCASSFRAKASPAYTVSPALFDRGQPDLGLQPAPSARSFTIFRAQPDGDHYANGAALIAFRGRLFAQWQSSARDEDSADTWVAYATSDDQGATWSTPRPLAPSGSRGEMQSSGGWWTDGETLVAYLNVWPAGFGAPAGGHAVYRLSTDGEHWSEPRRVLGRDGEPLAGILEQDIHGYAHRLHTTFHLPPGLIATPHFTDDPRGLSGWTAGALPHLPATNAKTSRELEPSLFARADGSLVMVFRDQASSYRQLASVSLDRGVTWSRPEITTMPDARAKQSAGNLPDGTAFLVNCPSGTRERLPLALTLAREGTHFDRAFVLRGTADLPPQRFDGRYKRPGYHYPKSLVAGDFLYVVYATNKEDIELTRVPLTALTAAAPTPRLPTPTESTAR